MYFEYGKIGISPRNSANLVLTDRYLSRQIRQVRWEQVESLAFVFYSIGKWPTQRARCEQGIGEIIND